MPSASGGSKVICGEKRTHHGGHGEGIFSVTSVTSVVKKTTTEDTENVASYVTSVVKKESAYLIRCSYLYFANNISTFITYWLHLGYRSHKAVVTPTATLAGLLNNNL